jgi:hypothetical protein
MNKRDITLTNEQAAQLWKEIAAVAAQPHIPEDILRTYLADNEFADAIESHLYDCSECRDLTDQIIMETSPWRDEPESLERAMQAARKMSATPPHPIALALISLMERQESIAGALVSWWDRLKRGANDFGVALQAEIISGQPGHIAAFPGLNQPDLQLAYGPETRGSSSAGKEELSVLMTSEGIGAGEVSVTGDSVTVTFFEVPLSDFPFVLLMSDGHPESVRVIQASETEPPGGLEAHFDSVTPGKYLIAIEPTMIPDVHFPHGNGIAKRISPALIRQIEELLIKSEGELLQDMGHMVLSRGFNAGETSPEEEEEEGKDYLARILPSLRKTLCDDSQIRGMLANPELASTVWKIAYVSDLLRNLKIDIEPETLATYLVKTGLTSLCSQA